MITQQEDVQRAEQLLSNAKEVLESAKMRVAELEDDLTALKSGLDLPTEPGWYLNKRDEICRLSEYGEWDDGWGNGGYGYGHHEYATPIRRLIVGA
jgi:hypothetical protein